MQTSTRNISAIVLVLQKVPHLGNKSLAYCLSPDLGRMTFFLRGAENPQKMKGQPFDLFRKLAVTCHCSNGNLYYADSVEILADYSAIAANYRIYDAACQLAAFAVRISQPNLNAEQFFLALDIALQRLEKGAISPEAAIVGCYMVALFEAGQLDYGRATEQERRQQEILLKMAVGGEIPNLSSDVWCQLLEWCERLVDGAF